MRWLAPGVRLGIFGALLALGCSSPAAEKTDPSLSGFVLSSVPADVQNTTLVDFGGAVHLVGWDLSPKGLAQPGTTLNLKLYWRSVKKLSDGWQLFTHVLVPGVPKPYAYDNRGTLRQKLQPSAWVPGTIYVDEQEIELPADVSATEVTLAVGLHRGAVQLVGREVDGLTGLRLPIISGLSDGHHRAVIATLPTGVNPNQRRAKPERKPKAERRPSDRPNLREPLRPGVRPGPMDPKETP
jgi:hypothetical protein